MGLGVALKNDGDQVARLVNTFDYELDEQCYEYSECGLLAPFIRAQQGGVRGRVQRAHDHRSARPAKALGFSSMKKNIDLDAPRTPC